MTNLGEIAQRFVAEQVNAGQCRHTALLWPCQTTKTSSGDACESVQGNKPCVGRHQMIETVGHPDICPKPAYNGLWHAACCHERPSQPAS